MDFLEKLGSLISGGADAANEAMSQVRYGVGANDKYKMAVAGSLPGAPSFSEDPAAAERYTSTYLGAKKWGKVPARIFNAIAFSDWSPSPGGMVDRAAVERAAARKKVGLRGIEAGGMARDVDEARRRARLLSLFGEQTES